MGRFFFAVVLVAAAFGGGAMVNGPGFRWAQDHVFDYMGLKDGGEIATIDLPPAPTDETALDAPPSSRSKNKTKARPRPEPDGKPEPRPSTAVAAEPTAVPAPTSAPAAAAASPPPSEPAPPPLLAGPSGEPGPAPAAPPAPLDPGVTPALLASLAPAPAPTTPAEAKPSPATAPSGSGDWAAVRDQLKAQGVTRYTIETDLQGRAVFSCLIPLAGRQAVSQRFEADGDDEFSAAHAALRRIKLWRATQSAEPTTR